MGAAAGSDGRDEGGSPRPLAEGRASAAGGAAGAANSPPDDGGSLAAALWRSGLWRILAVLLLYSLGDATLLPVMPSLFTDFFASRAAGAVVSCEAAPQLPACVDAHAQVVRWNSATSFVSNSVIAFLFSPLVGDASDARGRKPFLVAAFTLALLPAAVVAAHLWALAGGRLTGLLLFYYPASALSSAVSSIVICLSYCADKLPRRHRTAGFGLIIAAFSLGFVFGPLIGAALRPLQAAGVAVGVSAACALAVAVGVPESLPPALAAQARRGRRARPHPLDAALSLGRSWALINSRALFRRLALCMAILGVVQGGVQELIVQYLQVRLNFTTRDTSALFVVLGAANLFVQARRGCPGARGGAHG